MPLLIIFIIIPIIEITLLINVGQMIGAWYTIALVLLSAFVGVNMLRYQGLATLGRAQKKMQQGEMPGKEMVEGIALAVGGALLITPGFVTDIIGFCCLLPITRTAMVKLVSKRFKGGISTASYGGAANTHSAKDGDVFEGEYRDESPDRESRVHIERDDK